jgi:hypothetical protein
VELIAVVCIFILHRSSFIISLCVSVLKRPRATYLLALLFACAPVVNAQTPAPLPPTPQVAEAGRADDLVTRAITAVCTEREQDPQGSEAIDEMQAHPSLPLLHASVVAGAARAERLLPVAKTLAAEALRTLARDEHVAAKILQPALVRLVEVRHVKPDVDLRDNASVFYRDPHTIRFGTLFLAGLRSDEAMVSVLAHELTHVADGPHSALTPLFRRLAARAGQAARFRIAGHRSEELTCDLIGLLAARAYVAHTPSIEPFARRTARAIEHNCVTRDETDLAHLSPRRTLHALLALKPVFAREVTTGEAQAALPAPRRTSPRARHAAAHATPR